MRKIISLILLCSLLLCSCKQPDTVIKENSDFSSFTETIFENQAATDSLSLNYTLVHPEKYHISEYPKGFSSFDYEALKKTAPEDENLLAKLQTYKKDSLSFDQQILYDVLKYSLETEIQGQNYIKFAEALGPVTGIQAQFPVLLAEFRITSQTELAQYFQTMQTLPDYFNSLLSIEEKKGRMKTLPCRSTLQNIIAQCEEFSKGSSALLTSTFESRMKKCTFLTSAQKKDALSKNSTYVTKYIIPAYQSLIKGLTNLLPLAPEEGSLCSYPGGTEYYQHLVSETTGSSQSVESLLTKMKNQLDTSHGILLSYAKKDPSLFSSCQRYTTSFTSPEQILSHLKGKITSDFPACETTTYEVKDVDSSLENFLSPAFYLTPPIDDYRSNRIYINRSNKYDVSSLFNTLAHEGYPGHLYQSCYFRGKKLSPLRYLLDFPGYTEGWATYAEIYSFPYSGISTEEAAILQNNMISMLCLYGMCDIGIHAYGWDKEKIASVLAPYGAFNKSTTDSLYSAIIDEPASYLKYTVGYLEILQLKTQMKKYLGDSYTDKLFHTFLLDIGTAPFPVIESYISAWCVQNGCN